MFSCIKKSVNLDIEMPITRSGLWYGIDAAAACEPFEPYMQSAVEACHIEKNKSKYVVKQNGESIVCLYLESISPQSEEFRVISKASSGSLNAFYKKSRKKLAIWNAVEAANAAAANARRIGTGIGSWNPRNWCGRHVHYRIKKRKNKARLNLSFDLQYY